ncbi:MULTISPECIES: erythromycin esterase family protein [unclassified Bacillus (in: firmicutes)]|uniref:erythromycin esterase family protein n=1 Tax=unclassified Bacillus (in: firmicutes) TaxID=185979 RepID=UPI0008E15D3B|nr:MULTISPECIES: erythromycin esterase family protein [unclassified Bacillus (in: firmicutes)]SFA70061.1 Erythromycin esterase homolog [Bacillus sp. UNCCL13]SFQ59558.1 Erythromycin esterase homolog [Bacillus sp. cl95]
MDKNIKNAIQKWSVPIKSSDDLNPLIDRMAQSKIVLLGEASHGTSEFYTIRTEITKKLIKEKGFSFIAVEGDWPSCQEVNSYIKGFSKTYRNTEEIIISAFHRWPSWMWANREVSSLVEWLKDFNRNNKSDKKIGFYGLDVYSLWESMDEILNYLKKINSSDLETAKKAFSCFEPFNRNNETYAISAGYLSDDCTDEVVDLLTSIRSNTKTSNLDPEEALNLEVNALVAANAEEYYRSMVQSDSRSWNVRDKHMVEALNAIRKYYGEDAKVIIWEHNTHVGDARATDMQREGMLNVGQIVREQHKKEDVFIAGFGTHKGTVIASEAWGAEQKIMDVPPAKAFSWEDYLFQAGSFDKWLLFTDENRSYFSNILGHRAIGVVYQPEMEHYGNYVPSNLSARYDAFIYVDTSKALHPLQNYPNNYE